jgi:hypothetical protein
MSLVFGKKTAADYEDKVQRDDIRDKIKSIGKVVPPYNYIDLAGMFYNVGNSAVLFEEKWNKEEKVQRIRFTVVGNDHKKVSEQLSDILKQEKMDVEIETMKEGVFYGAHMEKDSS